MDNGKHTPTPEDVESDYIKVMQGGKRLNQVVDDNFSSSSIIVLGAIVGAALIFVLFACGAVHAEVFDAEQIADAIYIVEGQGRAVKPFGILSVSCEGYEDCRQVCINTIQNSFTRWQAEGSKGDFLAHLANRYSPPKSHPLNKNWLPNLRRVLK